MNKEYTEPNQQDNENRTSQRSFQGVWIPKEIYLDERLGALEKILLVEIASLDNGDGCFASNEYFAEFCQCSDKQVRNMIAKLKELGLVEQVKFDGRKRWLKTRMEKTSMQTGKNCHPDRKNLPVSKTDTTRDNINNIFNNINNNISHAAPYGTADGATQEHWEKFWASYIPVKAGGRLVGKGPKATAEKKYKRLLAKGIRPEDIMRGLQAYLHFCQTNGQLTCGVTVFLNQERWKDDYGGAVALARQQTKMNNAQTELMRQGAEFLRKYGENNESGNIF